jgi:phosphotransferase system enzyme I (PtsI)
MTLALTGQPVARGIAIARCHLAEHNELDIVEYRIGPDEVDNELRRFRSAIVAAREQLEDLAARVTENVGAAAGEVIHTHVVMLGDSRLRDSTENHIRGELCNAEWALQIQLERVLAEFRSIDDDYIRSRGEDITQVVRLVQNKLNEEVADKPFENMPDRLAETLVIAAELTPAELAILAQSLLQEGETLVLDGGLGVVYADPDEAIRSHYQQVQSDTRRFKNSLEAIRELPAVSLDGQLVSLQANAERAAELQLARDEGASGIGLYRTEFLYLQGAPPDEESQLAEFAGAIDLLGGLPLTIRTLDMGADKPGATFDVTQLRRAANPALGLRAIRLCLRDTDLFKAQLRAILRASALGPVRCLIPMLTSVHEIRMVHMLLDEAREELADRGIDFDPAMQVGGMIEVPAAAMSIADLGHYLDFISVGTNDLLQYTLAADRVDEQVAHLYDFQHPGVVRLLRFIFREAEALRIPATVCGEVAGDRRYTRLLLALGLKEFSMHPGRLLEVKQVVRETDIPQAKAALSHWLNTPAGPAAPPLLHLIDESQHGN